MFFTEYIYGSLLATFLIGLSAIFLLICYSLKQQTYWKRKSIPCASTIPLIGSVLENWGKTLQEVDMERHFKLGSIYGHYEGNRPILSVADPKLLRDIFVKDFAVFTNRRIFETGNEISDRMLSNLADEDWRRVRSILSPVFSASKLKRIVGIFKDCSITLVQNFKETSSKKKSINIKRFYEAFAMDVIANSAFSTKIDSHNDPQNEFVQAARALFGSGLTWRFILVALAPRLMKLFRISVANPHCMEFFTSVTTQIIDERKRTKQKMNDFLQLLMDTADEIMMDEKGDYLDKESDLTCNYEQNTRNQEMPSTSARKNKCLSMNDLVASCILFFVAGFETLTVALSTATYALATNKTVQDKVLQEIKEHLKDTNGVLTYEALQNMKYLDNVISESLRMYPPLARTERKAGSTYKLGDTGIILEKDMLISIPIYALHHDHKYFPHPNNFDPSRFKTEEMAKRDPYVYLPFGSGPRNCIGMRFALLQMKVCLVYVVSNFTIKTCSLTMVPMQFNRGFGMLQPKDILLEMEQRKDCPLI